MCRILEAATTLAIAATTAKPRHRSRADCGVDARNAQQERLHRP
jgi:hypothetical protein